MYNNIVSRYLTFCQKRFSFRSFWTDFLRKQQAASSKQQAASIKQPNFTANLLFVN